MKRSYFDQMINFHDSIFLVRTNKHYLPVGKNALKTGNLIPPPSGSWKASSLVLASFFFPPQTNLDIFLLHLKNRGCGTSDGRDWSM